LDITVSMVKELRDKTNAGMMNCKEALAASEGDLGKAVEYLRKKGLSAATKRSSRAVKEGMVESYIHMAGKIGVLLEVNCETDFVAKTDNFKVMVKDIAMHIAASNPVAISEEDLDSKLIESEKEIYRNKALNEGKPEKIIDRIVEGQIKKFIKQSCLLEQEFVKDPDKKVRDVINEAIVALGENMQVSRFNRYSLGS